MTQGHDELGARLRAADQQFTARGPTAPNLAAGVAQLEQRRVRQRWRRRTAAGVVAVLAIAGWWLQLSRRESLRPIRGPGTDMVQAPAVPPFPQPLPEESLALIRQTQAEITEQLARVRLQQLTWRFQDLNRQLVALDEQRHLALLRADLRRPVQVDPSIDFGF